MILLSEGWGRTHEAHDRVDGEETLNDKEQGAHAAKIADRTLPASRGMDR